MLPALVGPRSDWIFTIRSARSTRASAGGAPPLYELASVGPPGQKDVEGYREGVRVEAPKGPLGQAPVEGKAVLDFLWDTRVGCMVKLWPPEEEGGESEREEGGPGPPWTVFSFFFFSFCFLLLSFLCQAWPWGGGERGALL